MKSLLAAVLMIGAVVTVLAKHLLLAFLLVPLAWVAAMWAGRDHDDIGALMGICLMLAVVVNLAQCAGAL